MNVKHKVQIPGAQGAPPDLKSQPASGHSANQHNRREVFQALLFMKRLRARLARNFRELNNVASSSPVKAREPRSEADQAFLAALGMSDK